MDLEPCRPIPTQTLKKLSELEIMTKVRTVSFILLDIRLKSF